MANPNNPFGAQVLNSDGKQERIRQYNKTTGTAIYPGDGVKLIDAGTVSVAASGERLIGVSAEYRASADTVIGVYDDPDTEYYIQVSADFALADVGQHTNIVANAGDATLKQSNHTLNSATFGTEAAKQFKILGLLLKGENAVGSYAMVRAKINNHEFVAGPTGV